MKINISALIERFTKYKERVQEGLSEDDELLLNVVLTVLEQIEEDEK